MGGIKGSNNGASMSRDKLLHSVVEGEQGDIKDGLEDQYEISERETLAPPDMNAPLISHTREIKTKPPDPTLKADPTASIRYFQKIEDESSGEAVRLVECERILKRVWQALNNREFRADRSYLRSVFLMPFLKVDKAEAKVKVYAFDNDETSSPLYEICDELMLLPSHKNTDTSKNLSRKDRLNLIKAITEYFDDLLLVPSGSMDNEGVAKIDLGINHLGALETINRMDFELVLNDNKFPQFKIGRDWVTITSEQMVFFKQKLAKYLLEKHRQSKPVASFDEAVQLARESINLVSDDLAVLATPRVVQSTMASRINRVNLKLRMIQVICREILGKISTNSQPLDDLRALVMVEELTKSNSINFNEYVDLFELNDESDARILARCISSSRVELRSLYIPIEVLTLVLTEFLKNSKPIIKENLLAKLLKLEV